MCKKLGKDLLKKIYIFQLIKKITDYINTEVNYFTELSGRSSGVEHNLAKVRVGRSNRLARSNWFSAYPAGQQGHLRVAFCCSGSLKL